MIPIETEEMCECCKVNKARFISPSAKRLWCESNTQRCPESRRRAGERNKNHLSSIDPESGLSMAQLYAKQTSAKAAAEGRENPFAISGRKMQETIKKQGRVKEIQEKILESKRKIGEDGRTSQEKSNEKMVKSRNAIGEDGLTNYQRSARKAVNTQLNNIDENGHNGFDRIWIKAGQAKKYRNTLMYYRSTLEKAFLDKLFVQHGLEWILENVKNGKSIPYFLEGQERIYITDFVIDNKLYEIKSKYTLDDFGRNNEWKIKNSAKLDAALDAGFEVYLVLDEVEYLWKEYRTSYLN